MLPGKIPLRNRVKIIKDNFDSLSGIPLYLYVIGKDPSSASKSNGGGGINSSFAVLLGISKAKQRRTHLSRINLLTLRLYKLSIGKDT